MAAESRKNGIGKARDWISIIIVLGGGPIDNELKDVNVGLEDGLDVRSVYDISGFIDSKSGYSAV